MKQMTPCMGLQVDYDNIYKRNITKIQKFKKASLKKELQPAYFEVYTTFLLYFIIIKHCVGKKFKKS
jgi:hypothetical protein